MNACEQLTLICNNDAICIIDCNFSEYNSVCTESELIPKYRLPNLVNQTMSNYENSFVSCYSNVTNISQCENFGECEALISIDNTNNQAPICCTAANACKDVTNMTTEIALNSAVIDNTAIRCDGYISCITVVNIIAKEGGNIYVTGYVSGYSIDMIQTTLLYDIIVSGFVSCQHSTAFQNVNNVFCVDRCMFISFIRTVYNALILLHVHVNFSCLLWCPDELY